MANDQSFNDGFGAVRLTALQLAAPDLLDALEAIVTLPEGSITLSLLDKMGLLAPARAAIRKANAEPADPDTLQCFDGGTLHQSTQERHDGTWECMECGEPVHYFRPEKWEPWMEGDEHWCANCPSFFNDEHERLTGHRNRLDAREEVR